MAALLHQLLAGRRQERPAAAVPREYLARLVEAFEQAGLPIHPPVRRGGVVVAGLVEPLTERELEVLQLLAAGASNRAIAQQLVVTQETVKSTSATCSTSWGWPTEPRPSPGRGS
jgi:LuxR family transcriptional regulator, maltose regulon positive regulatory protein